MTTNCDSCNAHVEHAGQAVIQMLNCDDNDFDNAEEAFQYLAGYIAKLAEENEELQLE